MKLLIFVLAACSFAFSQEPARSETEHAKAAVDHGEAGQEHEMPGEIWWKWANFAILAIALGWLIRKNAGPYFRSRSVAIQQDIEEARKMKADADARATEIERKLANLNAEIESLRKSAHEEIAAENMRMRAETEQQLAKVQAHAEQEIAAAAKTASQELKTHAAELALKLAEEQLRNRITADTQGAFLGAFVRDLNRQAGTDGRGSRN